MVLSCHFENLTEIAKIFQHLAYLCFQGIIERFVGVKFLSTFCSDHKIFANLQKTQNVFFWGIINKFLMQLSNLKTCYC